MVVWCITEKMSERKQREQDKKKKFYNDLRENLDQVTAVGLIFYVFYFAI